jgi:hypothetical protein
MPAPRRLTLDVPLFVNTPSAGPGVTPTGGAAGHFTYKLVGIAADGVSHSAASAGTAITNGPTTLDGTHYNTIDQTGVTDAGAAFFDVYRTAGGTTQGKIGRIAVDGSTTLRDNGLVGDGATAPASNNSGTGLQASLPMNNGATVFVGGTFTATLQLQVTPDGTNWLSLGSTITGDAYASVPVCVAVRSTMSAYTSGTPTVTILYAAQ